MYFRPRRISYEVIKDLKLPLLFEDSLPQPHKHRTDWEKSTASTTLSTVNGCLGAIAYDGDVNSVKRHQEDVKPSKSKFM